jgi:hypothetical protein
LSMNGTSAAGKGESRPPKALTLRRVWTNCRWTSTCSCRGETLDGLPVVLVHGMVISSRYMVPTALDLEHGVINRVFRRLGHQSLPAAGPTSAADTATGACC